MRFAFLHRNAAARLALSAVVCLAACGGGEDTAPPATVGVAGGTVAGPNGAQVVIPPGALAAATPIAVAQASAGSPAVPSGMAAFGATYAFTPHGTTFSTPVTITVPFDAASVPAGASPVLYKTTAAGAWERVAGATVNAGTVTAQVTGFSWTVVGNVAPAITQQPQDASVVAPNAATFAVAAFGAPPLTLQWQRSDDGGQTFADIPGATAASYTTGATAIADDNNDRYRVVVGSPEGSTTSNAAILTVTATAPATLTVTVVGNGGVTSAPAGIDCGADCAETYAINTLVTLTAAPAAGSSFTGWSGDADCSDGSVTMSAARSCTATFASTPPPTPGVARIAAGFNFSFAIRANGDPLSWGSDDAGTLGAGNGDQSRNVPGPVLANNVVAVAAGGAHGVAVTGAGEVRGWGYNGFGQLGDGSNLTQESPVSARWDDAGAMRVFSDAREVCGGSLHSLVRRSNGEVRAMGYNANGQLGDGTTTERSSGVAVTGISNAIAIACRGNHSLTLLADGTVRAWGMNDAGQLGDGTTVSRNTPVPVAGLTNVIAIAAGSDHSLALRSDGSVWAWGSNVNGKLGDGTETDRVTPTATLLTSQITGIAAGDENSMALRNDGIVMSWGINETGQLGSGSLTPGFRPQPASVVGLTDVVAITFGGGGFGHALAVRSDGTVWAWGNNDRGQLGNGSTVPLSSTPVQVTGLNVN